jgi:hypothetical protein
LQKRLPKEGNILEIASGNGEHVAYFAALFPNLIWQPSDFSQEALASIEAWREYMALNNILKPLYLDMAANEFSTSELPHEVSAILNFNMTHISPWECTHGLMRLSQQVLKATASLILYGPYKREGVHTAQSNIDFDRWLKSQNPSWGIRDLDEVVTLAAAHHLRHTDVIEMPANNHILIFCRDS